VKDKEEKSSPEITRIPREAGEKYMSEVQEKKMQKHLTGSRFKEEPNRTLKIPTLSTSEICRGCGNDAEKKILYTLAFCRWT